MELESQLIKAMFGLKIFGEKKKKKMKKLEDLTIPNKWIF